MRPAFRKDLYIYGSSYVEVGGSIDGDDVKADPAPRATETVPLTYWANSSDAYDEMDHAASAVGWVDLTCLDDRLAMLCVRAQKPYLGFCPTENHMHILRERLDAVVFESFQKVGDSLYEPSMSDIVSKPCVGRSEADAGAGGNPPQSASKATAKAKGKPSPGAKPPAKEHLLATLKLLEDGGDGADAAAEE